MQLTIGQLPIIVNHILNVFSGETLEEMHYFLDVEKFKTTAEAN
jgi:hypothetical protein